MKVKNSMDLRKIYTEEDLFPREIARCERRSYGLLFYCEENRDSYDSNHAVIYRRNVADIRQVLAEIVRFYSEKGIRPMLYQSISDDGYFNEIKQELTDFGFSVWEEPQNYMILSEKNTISPSPAIVVRKESLWKEEYGTEIFEKAGEPWEIGVVKASLMNKNTLFFVAFYGDKPVGMTHAHVTDGVCRVDYLLVSKEYRNIGVGRALIHAFVEYWKDKSVTDCYLWPDGETAEKIYSEAGFRTVEVKQAGRAVHTLTV